MWLRQNNVDRYIREFGEFYFLRADKEQLDFRSKSRIWNREVKYLFSALAQRGAIAKPGIEVPTLPIGEGETSRGSTMLVDSAILDMPPGLKDHQLKDLMYNRLTESVELLKQWADKETKQLWARWIQAQKLAKAGSPRQFRADGLSTANALAESSWERDCCATYAEYGHAMHRYSGLSKAASSHSRHVYGRDAEIVLETVCIPVRGSLLPHATLLVAAHPEVTTSMLETLEVEEVPGGLRVVRGESAHRYAIMYKARKGPDGAETKVRLTARTAQLLDQVLALTEPLRTYLRSINDPDWKKLFLSTSGLTTKPSVENFSATCTRREEIQKVRGRIQRITGLSRPKVQKLTEHFTLRTLRATMGTLVYLRTGSTEAMASALGHSGHSTQLIDKYLPKQIRIMVEEYWIRSFQMSLMATALKSSDALRVVISGADPVALMKGVRFDFIDSVKQRRISSASNSSKEKKRLVVEVSDNSLTEMIVFNERLARSSVASGDEMFLGSFVRTLVRLIDQTTNRPDWTAMLSRSRAEAAHYAKGALR